MTSKTSRPPTQFIPYRMVLPEDFVCPDPERQPDVLQQSPVLEECAHLLRHHFVGRPEVHIGGAGFVYYQQGDMNRRFEPDMHISFGVDASSVFRRNGYIIWEVGKAPDFALEVASESTHAIDTDFKPGLYASVGISEYWRFDATGGEFYGYPLEGDLLRDGVYQPLPLTTEPDSMVWGYSPALDLCLCAQGQRLRFYDRKTRRYLHNITESNAALSQSYAALAEVTAERNAERAARLASEAEVERLQEQVRRLQGQ